MTDTKRADRASDLIRCYKKVFSTEDGKRVLYDLINSSGILNEGFTKNAGQMAYLSGRKSIVLNILGTLDTDPEMFREAILESQKQQEYLNDL